MTDSPDNVVQQAFPRPPFEPGTYLAIPKEFARRRDLTALDKLVVATIVERFGGNGCAWPGHRTIAEAVGCRAASVSECVARIEKAGVLEVRRPGERGNSRNVNLYRLPSATETGAPSKSKRYGNRSAGATESVSQALRKPEQNNPREQPKGTTQGKRSGKKSGKRSSWDVAVKAMAGGELRTDAFEAKWGEWCRYRQEARKPLTPTTIKSQIHKLEKYGHDRAIESISQTIEAGWTGIFEPKEDGRPRGTKRQALDSNARYLHLRK